MTDERNETITALFRALSDYDGDVLRTLFTEDASLVQPERPAYSGPDGAVQMLNDLSRSYTEFAVQPNRTVGEGEAVAVEWTATITDFGGGQSRVDGCSVLDFQGDRIHRLRSYWRPEDTNS